MSQDLPSSQSALLKPVTSTAVRVSGLCISNISTQGIYKLSLECSAKFSFSQCHSLREMSTSSRLLEVQGRQPSSKLWHVG